ncbi:MAG: T9SS type A sorting domain-containing protein [Sphingobacteriales bacterium]|nr:MAG: T9SS type A sorting domain-containing protein [Sphingobacteriales bacterium]
MKKIFTFSALSLMALGANAQVTLTQSSYAGFSSTAAVGHMGVSGLTLGMPANNSVWDLSTVNYDPYVSTIRQSLSISSLPQATFGEYSGYGFGSFGYGVTLAEGITANGYQRFGEEIHRQAYGLGTLTGNINDSLIFNEQVVAYSSPRNMIAFPATAGSSWQSVYNYATDFNVTIASYMLNNTPCKRVTYVEHTDTVKGWGQMRLKVPLSTDPTGYMDVLAVEATIKVKDSFFLNGSPAPAPMLSAFGLTQGQIENSYYTYYYRADEINPLLKLEFADANRTPVTSGQTSFTNLPLNVKNVLLSKTIQMYPNPSTDGNITLKANELNSGNWTFELVNVAGQKVATGHLSVNNGTATFNIGKNVAGTYYLNMTRDGVRQASKTLILQ